MRLLELADDDTRLGLVPVELATDGERCFGDLDCLELEPVSDLTRLPVERHRLEPGDERVGLQVEPDTVDPIEEGDLLICWMRQRLIG